MTGIKPLQFDDLYYKGHKIVVLDRGLRLPFNFAVNYGVYCEFRTLSAAKSFIRSIP